MTYHQIKRQKELEAKHIIQIRNKARREGCGWLVADCTRKLIVMDYYDHR